MSAMTADPISCKCGSDALVVANQTFANGLTHLRADCARCRRFVKFLTRRPVLADADQAPPVALRQALDRARAVLNDLERGLDTGRLPRWQIEHACPMLLDLAATIDGWNKFEQSETA